MSLRHAFSFGWLLAPVSRLTLVLALLLTLALVLAGCGGPEKQDLPKLRDVRSRVTPVEPPRDRAEVPRSRTLAQVQQIALPLRASVEEAWSLVDEQIISAAAQQAWNANGLRIGTISEARLNDFLGALPHPVATERAQLVATEHPMSLRRSPGLRRAVRVRLPGPVDAMADEWVENGRVQLLARMSSRAVGGVAINLLPHHYKPELSLRPRDPLEKQLDGRLFHELGLRLLVPPGQVMVIGLYWPPPSDGSPDTDTASPEQDEDEQEKEKDQPVAAASPRVGQERPDSRRAGGQEDGSGEPPDAGQNEDEDETQEIVMAHSEGETLPSHLGRAIMAGERFDQPRQMLMIMSLQPLRRSQPAPPTAKPAELP